VAPAAQPKPAAASAAAGGQEAPRGSGSPQGAGAAAKPAAISWPAAGPPACTVAGGKASYSNGRTAISSAIFRPAGAGPFPAVLVLHSRGGLNPRHEPPFGQFLAAQGYVSLVPDYFTPEGIAPSAFEENWAGKADGVRQDLALGIDCLKSLAYVAPSRIGSVGFSLGGYWDLMLATRDDVRGVVNWYGAYVGRPVNPFATQYAFSDLVSAARAPILMLHGEADTEVPLALAQKAKALFDAAGKPADLVTYPGVTHAWDLRGNPDYTYDDRTVQDARARTLAFLAAKLKAVDSA
jgi:dienelactone hydrolase